MAFRPVDLRRTLFQFYPLSELLRQLLFSEQYALFDRVFDLLPGGIPVRLDHQASQTEHGSAAVVGGVKVPQLVL